jgi:branched-chain amino acid transport system ATP-binding protein
MLEIQKINVSYGDLQALWDVSVSVSKDEIVGIIGPNGAGKTTLLKTVAGLLKPGTGSIVLDGNRIDALSADKRAERGICLVPEGRGLFDGMTVLENLELGAYNSSARKAMEDSLALVYGLFPVLKERGKQIARTMSGGEQQMLAIGRGLMSRPRYILLDEPSWGLSPLLAKLIFKAIEHIHQSGMNIVLVEQNVYMSLELANRAYILESGRIAGQGESKTLLNDDYIKDAYLGLGAIQGKTHEI